MAERNIAKKKYKIAEIYLISRNEFKKLQKIVEALEKIWAKS